MTTSPEESWQPKAQVGRFKLLAKLAQGGMAEIWLARQEGMKGFEKLVVIKRILEQFTQDPDFVEMFLDEARIAAQLNHPNIVQIFDLGEHQGGYYIAMEYLSGEALSAVVRAGKKAGKPLPIPYAAKLVALAAEGLHHAHVKVGSNGRPLEIVHRDVSPQNLIVTFDGSLKVVDFGIAKAANRATSTSGGQLKGKASYMSPEQASGAQIDARTDVFALGVVLWEALTGLRLFYKDDAVQTLKAVTDPEEAKLAHELNPQVPRALSFVVARALAKDLSKRYASAQAFQVALENWLRDDGTATGTAEIAAYLRSIMSERIASQASLIESARHSDEPATGQIRQGLKPDTGSMPGASGTAHAPASPPPRKRPTLAIGIGAGVLVAALGAGVALSVGGEEEPRPAPSPAIANRPALLRIETDPPGAQLQVDGKPVGSSPALVEDLAPGPHQVSASMNGHQPTQTRVELKPGGRSSIVLSLAQLPAVAVPAAPGPIDAGAPTPVAEAPPRLHPPVSPPNPTKKTVSAAAKGRLTLDTAPWTAVFLGGKKLGDTPLVEVALPAGKQTLTLVNEEKGIKRRVEIDIPANGTAVKKLRL